MNMSSAGLADQPSHNCRRLPATSVSGWVEGFPAKVEKDPDPEFAGSRGPTLRSLDLGDGTKGGLPTLRVQGRYTWGTTSVMRRKGMARRNRKRVNGVT
jgi:hypothetical protein